MDKNLYSIQFKFIYVQEYGFLDALIKMPQ